MKFILRFTSTNDYGFGIHADGIGLIYSYLLQKYGIDFYNDISILQCGKDVEEFVMFSGKKNAHVNIKYPGDKDFENKTDFEKNLLRLNVIHEALLRLAMKDEKLSAEKIIAIREEILANKFLFDIPYKSFPNRKRKDLVATIIIRPEEKTFKFFALIEENKKTKCKVFLYNGRPDNWYIPDFFKYGKWRGLDKVIISGEQKDMEIHILIDKCKLEIANYSKYDKHPVFEMNRSGISDADKKLIYQNWLDSLPPDIAEAVKNEDLNDKEDDDNENWIDKLPPELAKALRKMNDKDKDVEEENDDYE